MTTPHPRAGLLAVLFPILALGLLAGCGNEEAASTGTIATEAAPPLADCEDAYEYALHTKLPERKAEERSDLHNVYKLSDNIIAGGEPLTQAALQRVADMGVKTILSVDGKMPDAKTAADLGMRYVHVPIRYNGIRPDEMAKIAKTFREMEGPFYVHCYHGKHRGPAGAAVGRLVLDGASREEALAEMRQWCGTAEKYRGLYDTIAEGAIPPARETQNLDWTFESAHGFEGLRQSMIPLARYWDQIKFAQKRGWQNDPDHPDIDMANEASKVAQLIAHIAELDEIAEKPADFKAWMKSAVPASRDLETALESVQAGEDGSIDVANARFVALGKLCSSCHKPYRNAE